MSWPDVVVAGILLWAGLRGFKRGFVSEIGGVLAMAAALWAAITYRGAFDAAIVDATGMNAALAHALGALATATGAYVFVALIAAVANRFARLPIVGTANAFAGTLAGLLKGVVAVWIFLYGILFFPIGAKARAEIKSSAAGSLLLAPNAFVDAQLEKNVPAFARPYADPAIRAHQGFTPAAGATPS
jgi:uncharacterized membrane protein required for colicin V production